jgi:hypothetical protein
MAGFETHVNAPHRSRYECCSLGASFPAGRLLRDPSQNRRGVNTTDLCALILEYEAVGLREAELLNIPAYSVEAIVRAFCFFGRETPIHFWLRPSLPDVERFGIGVMTPREFLRRIEGRKDE